MSRNQIVFVLGVLLVLVSFSGFPREWKMYFTVATGVLLMLLALRNYWLRREIIKMRERALLQEDGQVERGDMSHV
jgi:hypothetical protein